MNIIPPAGGEGGGGGIGLLPVKQVIGGRENTDSLVLRYNQDYYIFIPDISFNGTPPDISLTSDGNFYLYDVLVYEAKGSGTGGLPINCVFKIKSTFGRATLNANDGYIFVLDM